MALTDIQCKKLTKQGKHTDGHGLYLHVTKTGKYWRYAYRFGGKQKTLSIGAYPMVTLVAARQARMDANALLAQGKDPSTEKIKQKLSQKSDAINTFEALTKDFLKTRSDSWSKAHTDTWRATMEKHLLPHIGAMPVAHIERKNIVAALEPMHAQGIISTARRVVGYAKQVFSLGVVKGLCAYNPATDLGAALKNPIKHHQPAIINPKDFGQLLRSIDGYCGQPTTKAALQLAALTFQRPGNIRAMEWAWVDIDSAMLTIPAASMKRRVQGKTTGEPHEVPLSVQAVAILKDLKPLTGEGRYVFPHAKTASKPMDNATLSVALGIMGYGRKQTAHGFRASAQTLMLEAPQEFDPLVIEALLAHTAGKVLGGAYNRTKYSGKRAKVMQDWADYMDSLKRGAEVVPFPGKAA